MTEHDEAGSRSGVTRRRVLTGSLAMAAGAAAWWWPGSPALAGPVTTDRFGDQNQTLPRGRLPDFAISRGTKVQESYRYAAERGDALEHIPCFCGCNDIGHKDNRDCYIKSVNRDGTVTYTSHAAT